MGKGASALVDGVTETLIWIDPFTWATKNDMNMEATRPKRQLVLCEAPFVVLQGDDIRYTREGKNGPVRLAKAKNARVTIITPDGRSSASAGFIHYRGPSQEVVLEKDQSLQTRSQYLRPWKSKQGMLMKLDFVNRTVSCDGVVVDALSGW